MKKKSLMSLKIVIFFVGLLVLFLSTNLIYIGYRYQNKSGTDERDVCLYGILHEEPESIDVLFLGDSLCYTGLSPLEIWNEFGYTSYSCAQTAQRLWEAFYLLKNALKNQSPKVVVLETNMLFWKSNFANDANDSFFEMASYYFPILEYHNQWKGFPNIDNSYDVNCRLVDKGFRMKTGRNEYGGDGTYILECEESTPINKIELYYFKKILNLCKREGADLLLVSVPSPYDYNGQDHNALMTLSQDYQVKYLNMNLPSVITEMAINWEEDVYDPSAEHLNAYGAKKVSAYLGKYILDNYKNISPCTEKETIEKWDNAFVQYVKEWRQREAKPDDFEEL